MSTPSTPNRPNLDGDRATTRLSRRALLKGSVLTGTSVVGAGILGASTASARTAAPSSFNPASWESVRAQFNLNPQYANFTAWMLAPHSATVRAAIAEYRDVLDTNPHQFALPEEDFVQGEHTREVLGRFLGAEPAQIALTDSTTMGIGLVYGGLRLRARDEVLTTEHDFYPTHETLRLRAQVSGCTVRKTRLHDNPAQTSVDEIVTRLQRAIVDRTRVIALTWVHSGTGVMLPLKEISQMVAGINARRDPEDHALLCVDGVHGFGAEEVTIGELGVDFFMSGTHKWLFGPRGTGFVLGKAAAWESLQPIFTSFSEVGLNGWLNNNPPPGPAGDLNTPGGFHSFENRWALPQAIEFYEAIGKRRVAARTKSQAAQLKNGIEEIPHVRLVTPHDPKLSSGIVCCAVDGIEPGVVAERLLKEHKIFASSTPYPESFVRFGPSILTTPREVDKALSVLRSLR